MTALSELLDMDVLAPFFGERLVVGVSGGSDSIGLLHALIEAGRFDIHVVTFDHQLREDAAREAEFVHEIVEARGGVHRTLQWENPKTQNLQAAAREARYSALQAYAKSVNARGICLGHTQDDQAETVLMRLIRGSGVDGLAGMKAVSGKDIPILRPFLARTRTEIREALKAQGATWIDDPSNENADFLRVGVRQFITTFDIPQERIARTAAHMARAETALTRLARDFEAEFVTHKLDVEAEMPRREYLALDEETRFRVLSAVLNNYGRQSYRPRFEALEALIAAICLENKGRFTLHHCEIWWSESAIKICQEPANLPPAVSSGEIWNGIWKVNNCDETPYQLGPLGEFAANERTAWRAFGLSAKAAMALPTLFEDGAPVYVHGLSKNGMNCKTLPIVKKA